MFIDPHIHMNARTTDDYEARQPQALLQSSSPLWQGNLDSRIPTSTI